MINLFFKIFHFFERWNIFERKRKKRCLKYWIEVENVFLLQNQKLFCIFAT
jgi:hypothetical protein